MQDPGGAELASLVHGNRLMKANLSTAEELRDLWSSPAAKDRLRRASARMELLPSNPENTEALNRYLMEEDGEMVPDAPLHMTVPEVGQPGERQIETVDMPGQVVPGSPNLQMTETRDGDGPRFTLRLNLKHLRERQQALDEVLGHADKRQKSSSNLSSSNAPLNPRNVRGQRRYASEIETTQITMEHHGKDKSLITKGTAKRRNMVLNSITSIRRLIAPLQT